MNRSVLAVGGHIGDMDLAAGPTLAKLALEGANVTIVALTPGERGHPRLSPAEYQQQKVAEGEAFATAIGADFMVLGYSEGFLPDSDDVALELATIIREKQPDTVITHWRHSSQRDHEHAARVTERAVYLADLPMEHELPRHAVRTLVHTEHAEDLRDFAPSAYVPIPDDAFYRWVGAIRHQAFARGETDGFRHIDYYTALMTMRGCQAGYPRACAFFDPSGPEVTKLAAS
ncbi:LmbE family protein [Kribbella sp. ALI-6-A]|uniref:PIG-L deacetylase family protein n=1 Tax=Kribbella sp. ALI-6-A TaxID=1933817 RepID=UPI00097C1D25|nr:PIG-L family deacetylase [Kribbella sp. ALI-6-A]ONI72366.1 LmbE family protein [Kribbella sp. ALI-6-A]